VDGTAWGGVGDCALVSFRRVDYAEFVVNMVRNAPILLGLRSILYPLAAGCTVVFKASERCPRTHHLLVKLLQDAGLPGGAVTMVLAPPGDPEGITKRIIADKRVRKINFTGSTKVGSLISSEAGKHLKPVLMELGGKSAVLVLEDANLDLAVREAVTGAFMNVGQICTFPVPSLCPKPSLENDL
jgi:acyl-CoA reductase-like NAD-dependent aldehyde dehydrogenase